jgi:hypothetical protein
MKQRRRRGYWFSFVIYITIVLLAASHVSTIGQMTVVAGFAAVVPLEEFVTPIHSWDEPQSSVRIVISH